MLRETVEEESEITQRFIVKEKRMLIKKDVNKKGCYKTKARKMKLTFRIRV